MMATWLRLVALCVVSLSLSVSQAQDSGEWDFGMDAAFQDLLNATKVKNIHIAQLARQLVLNQYQAQERVRMEGNSGLVKMRSYHTGMKNYHTESVHAPGFAGIHDMSMFTNFVGVGELSLVMNGIPFTTRHSDYRVEQPSTQSTTFLETEPIPTPPVPPTVEALTDVTEQIAEMQEYFRAFKTNNDSHRDFKPYFKPVLCYIEGYWSSETETPQEMTDWATYRLNSFEELQDNNMLNSFLGVWTDQSHRAPNLPRQLIALDNDGNPIYAQWNYRFLCKPFDYDDITTDNFVMLDDLQYRMSHSVLTTQDLFYTRGARFVVKGDEENVDERIRLASYLDQLVATIPGVDNFPGSLTEKDIYQRSFKANSSAAVLNAAYYNRVVYDSWRDAMRANTQHRFFNDPSLYVALTSHEEVAPLHVVFNEQSKSSRDLDLRATFLLPFEVMYMTPLLTWNPYNITYHEGNSRTSGPSGVVRADGRNGKASSPWNGNNYETFVRTPYDFFSSRPTYESPDVAVNDAYVLDSTGESRRVVATNTRVILDKIGNDVGSVRLRYPILPLHEDGSYYAKEFNAYRDHINQQLIALSEKLEAQMNALYADQSQG